MAKKLMLTNQEESFLLDLVKIEGNDQKGWWWGYMDTHGSALPSQVDFPSYDKCVAAAIESLKRNQDAVGYAKRMAKEQKKYAAGK